ncbi:sugar phosphate isomerase/epimerase [Ancylobacter sp. Lp-2]|uniref:sugar phosphate isomerase/epimerase family protein n=1 Tax=Ancylobacter sp. Lp-2 TaxID=2881339 RepID=UPI001E64CC5B|nr:sugar phosphate isomerase/epimerase [Ancylobacter sp. Lp-2]MCB4769662.1 sugar phosphate isomerase/epimerase [Ancylobacter sp. Lp-2]
MSDRFRLALHSWTTDTTPLKDTLQAACAAGYDAVELRRLDFERCFEAGVSRPAAIDMIAAAGISLGILGTEYGWFFAEGEEQRRMFAVLRESCEIAVALGCGLIMSAPGIPSGTVAQAIAATRIAGDIVGEYGLRLALEFNSQHPLVNNIPVLREIIDGSGHAHCGLLLDAYHLHRGRGGARSLLGVRGEEILVFQYSDAPPVPDTGVRRPIDRLPPGDGVIDWDEMFGLLRATGYQGYLSYEAPNPAQWNRPARDVAEEGLLKTRALLARLPASSLDRSA